MAVMLTRSLRETLLLKLPRLMTIPATILLAVCLHPVLSALSQAVVRLYPMNSKITESLKPLEEIIKHEASIWHLLLLIAVLPAICEELALRGFILSGLRHLGHRRAAIIISAVFFGLAHSFIQQSVMTCFIGVILGFIAVRTASILPCILYHMIHNGLSVLSGRYATSAPFSSLMKSLGNDEYVYHNWVVLIAGCLAILLLVYFRSLDWKPTEEEALQEVLDHEQDYDHEQTAAIP